MQPGYVVSFIRKSACVEVTITAIWKDGSIGGTIRNDRISFSSEKELISLPKFHLVATPELPICYVNDAWRLL